MVNPVRVAMANDNRRVGLGLVMRGIQANWRRRCKAEVAALD
jgi:hypothetical protein